MGGGGLRGLAHVGALRALEQRNWIPADVVGVSMGALVAASWAVGFAVDEIQSMAVSIRRRDIFRIAHSDMAFKRMQSPALYRFEPLENLVRGLVGEVTFGDLPRPLLIATVDINSGTYTIFGLPGTERVRVLDAVMASCALPGFFPPREIDGRFYVDGALVDNLPARLAAARGWNGVVAVDVGATSVLRADTQDEGFAAVFLRATEIVFQQAMERHLAAWSGPPLLLVQPRVEHIPIFSFDKARELIAEGERATRQALDQAGEAVRSAAGGIHPQRLVQVKVNRDRCTGCGACVALAPQGMFRLDGEGKAVGPDQPLRWSPVDGSFIRHCPTWAITARPAAAGASIDGATTGTGRDSS